MSIADHAGSSGLHSYTNGLRETNWVAKQKYNLIFETRCDGKYCQPDRVYNLLGRVEEMAQWLKYLPWRFHINAEWCSVLLVIPVVRRHRSLEQAGLTRLAVLVNSQRIAEWDGGASWKVPSVR